MISETLINLDASHQVSVNRYGVKLANQVIPFLESAQDSLETQLLKEGITIRNKSRLSALLSATNKTLSKYYLGYIEDATEGLESLVSTELSFVDKSINSIVSDYDTVSITEAQVIKAATLNPMQLENGAVNFPHAFSNWKMAEIRRAQNLITLGFFQGQTTQQISKSVSDAIGGVTRRNATAIARTATNHMASQTRNEFYKENDDLVKGYQLVATLDSRTSSYCRNIDGKIIKPGDVQLMPPFHFSCRTTTTPVLSNKYDFLDKGATRSAANGPVSSTTTYYDWLKKQPASMQDDVLGKTKGKIFRNSGVSTDEFKSMLTNRMGKELTIEQLAKKDSRIMEYLK